MTTYFLTQKLQYKQSSTIYIISLYIFCFRYQTRKDSATLNNVGLAQNVCVYFGIVLMHKRGLVQIPNLSWRIKIEGTLEEIWLQMYTYILYENRLNLSILSQNSCQLCFVHFVKTFPRKSFKMPQLFLGGGCES